MLLGLMSWRRVSSLLSRPLPSCLPAHRRMTIGWAILLLARQRVRLPRWWARSLLLLALVSGFKGGRRLVFCHALLTSLYFSDKQTEDRPESPVATSKVELSLQEVPQQEEEKSVEGSTAVAQGILGCHSALVVSDFLYSSTCVGLSSTLS